MLLASAAAMTFAGQALLWPFPGSVNWETGGAGKREERDEGTGRQHEGMKAGRRREVSVSLNGRSDSLTHGFKHHSHVTEEKG